MKVSSKVKLNMGVIRQLSNAATVSLEQTAEALMGDLKESETMPFDKGTLQTHLLMIQKAEMEKFPWYLPLLMQEGFTITRNITLANLKMQMPVENGLNRIHREVRSRILQKRLLQNFTRKMEVYDVISGRHKRLAERL
mgnify:CR=1 FL=1